MDEVLARSVAQELHIENSRQLGLVSFHGDSMLPLLADGDALVVEPVTWDRLRAGDIVVSRFEDKFPALRVAEKLASKLSLLADNWPGAFFDAWPEDILGKVVARVRDGGELACDDRAWRRAAFEAVAKYRIGRAASTLKARSRKLADRFVRDFRAVRGGMLGMPTSLQVNVSSVCNLRCRMCPYLGVHKDDEYLDFMSRDTFEGLLPTIKLLGSVHLSGSGEPLANKDFPWFLERARTECPHARIEMTTNGTLLRERIAAALIRFRVGKVHVSIDGSSSTTVESIRRGVDLDLLLGNLERLDRMKREAQSTLPVVMANYMTGYGTYWELVDFVGLASRVGISEVNLLEMQPSCHDDQRDTLLTGVRADGGRTLKDAIQLGQRLGVTLHLPFDTSDGCAHPYTPHIGEDGEVYPCCYLDYDGRRFFAEGEALKFPSVSFGNVVKSGFDKVWNSSAYTRMRRRTARGDFSWYCKACHGHRRATSNELVLIGRPAARPSSR